MVFKNYPGIFLHGIDLNKWYHCHNISLKGFIWSPDLLINADSRLINYHKSFRDISIEDIKEFKLPANFPSPRTKRLYEAINIKRKLSNKLIQINELDDSQKDILKLFDIEIKFEEIR